mmetsp:Transcript_8907/g.33629  ORF Transcript_8907/g.33629 Transcript_8907/m.33629 type:complete len:253 (-) Transcript_8907:102-860(-)
MLDAFAPVCLGDSEEGFHGGAFRNRSVHKALWVGRHEGVHHVRKALKDHAPVVGIKAPAEVNDAVGQRARAARQDRRGVLLERLFDAKLLLLVIEELQQLFVLLLLPEQLLPLGGSQRFASSSLRRQVESVGRALGVEVPVALDVCWARLEPVESDHGMLDVVREIPIELYVVLLIVEEPVGRLVDLALGACACIARCGREHVPGRHRCLSRRSESAHAYSSAAAECGQPQRSDATRHEGPLFDWRVGQRRI